MGAVGAADQVLEVGWQEKASVQYVVKLACLQPQPVSPPCLVPSPCVGYSAFVALLLPHLVLQDAPAEDCASFVLQGQLAFAAGGGVGAVAPFDAVRVEDDLPEPGVRPSV